MPNITVELLKGRTLDQRRQFVQRVADAAVECLNARRESVRIMMVQIDKEDVSTGGVFVLDDPSLGPPGL